MRFDASQAVAISSHDELLALEPAMLRSLSAELGVEEISARLCPALLADNTVAILSLAEHVGSDQADELARHVQSCGYTLATPPRYVLAAPLLLAIARNQVGRHLTGQPRNLVQQHSRTALAEAFQDMVEWGVRNRASDLHINIRQGETDSEVKYTISGRYVAPERFCRMPTSMLVDMMSVAWMDIRGGNGAVFDPGAEQQGSLLKEVDGRPVLLRWASLSADPGPSVCIRLLEREAGSAGLTLEQLGYLPRQIQAIEQAMQTEGGAIVFAGAVGSGKSTTLASLIARLTDDRKVVTLEDPVEYLIPRAIQNTVVRDFAAREQDAFGIKLRALKRSAMNDVLLGEIRDKETGRAFMDLAGSGVNVYTTTHALSAALIADRLASDFIGMSRDFLATPGMLKLLVYQVLLPRLCQYCALPVSALWERRPLPSSGWRTPAQWRDWAQRTALRFGGDMLALRMRNPSGCSSCLDSQLAALAGYKGRTVVAEHIEPAASPGFLESIRGNDSLAYWRSLAQDNAGAGMVSALECAVQKALRGEVDLRDIEQRFGVFGTRDGRRSSHVAFARRSSA
jgi:type II secretory ATPase GspE/PulE/Tfp pilus assembly ATPase PilB-like protein